MLSALGEFDAFGELVDEFLVLERRLDLARGHAQFGREIRKCSHTSNEIAESAVTWRYVDNVVDGDPQHGLQNRGSQVRLTAEQWTKDGFRPLRTRLDLGSD